MTPLTYITVGSRLFCTAAPGLSIGTALAPGFGRRMQDLIVYTKEGLEPTGAIPALLESIWEVVRLHEFPELPSRLECLFLWQQESRAVDFASRRPYPVELYEVEVSSCSRLLIADMDLISYLEEPETVASIMKRARLYWKAEQVGAPEVLLEGTVTVVKLIG